MSTYKSPFAPKTGSTLTLTSTQRQVNGRDQPLFGIGAWLMSGSSCTEALKHALDVVGYRHIDTARYYRNEKEVGNAIHQSKVPREQIFLTTKVFGGDMGSNSRPAIESSLSNFNLPYIDLVLLHAPDGGKKLRLQTWSTLSEMVKEGKIKSLGVSNFGPHHIKELIESKPIFKPVVNQIECHPFFAQKEVREVSEKEGILIQAYCPLARGQYYGNKTLISLSKKHNVSESQIMLRWSIQSGIIPLPKSSNPSRQIENAESLSFELSEEEMKDLDGLDLGERGAVESQSSSQEAP